MSDNIDHNLRFYFYQSAIGDLKEIVERHIVDDLEPTPGFVTNAFGVKVNMSYFPQATGERQGVEPPPIPCNWHSDLAEFGAALHAVEMASEKFTVVELGCGWGCWLNITGAAARRRGLDVCLIGVEGDAGHVEFAKESLSENGFLNDQFIIHHGIASAFDGYALFPIQEQSGVSWGLEARFDVPAEDAEALVKSGAYSRLRQIPLAQLLPQNIQQIDLLHVDIQGAEIPLIPNAIDFLNEKVAMVLIGTHSKRIEADLFDSLGTAGWVLEVERPAILSVGKQIQTLVDGVQLWRNPNLVHDMPFTPNDCRGSSTVIESPSRVAANTRFSVEVGFQNDTERSWRNELA